MLSVCRHKIRNVLEDAEHVLAAHQHNPGMDNLSLSDALGGITTKCISAWGTDKLIESGLKET